jgi:hypothetical protein
MGLLIEAESVRKGAPASEAAAVATLHIAAESRLKRVG